MAKTSIGTAALILSANGAALGKGLDSAYKSIQGFKGRVTSAFASLGSGSPAIAAVLGGTKLVGDAIKSIADLSAIGKQAKGLGISSEQFQGLGLAAKRAGIESTEFGDLLGKLQGKIAGGAKGVPEALNAIGLSLGELQGKSGDQQFLMIADAMQKVGAGGEASFAAMKLFEGAGQRLLPVLTQGGDKLRAFIEQQKKLGTVLGDSQMSAVMKAQAAMPKIQAAFEGLWNRIVVAAAPAIEAFAKVFSKILEKAQPVLDWIARAAEAYYAVIGPAIEEVIEAIGYGIQSVGEWAASLFDFGGQWPTVGDVVTGVLRAIGIAGAYAFDVLKAGAGVVVVGLSLLVDAFGLVLRGMKNLLEAGAKLPDSLGGKEFKAAAATVQGWQTKTENAAEGMRKWGAEAVMGFGNSADKVRRWFDALKEKKDEVLDMGPVAEQISAATEQIKSKAAESTIVFGTKEDYSYRVQFEANRQKSEDAVVSAIKQGNEQLKAANRNLETIAGQPTTKLKKL